MKKQTLTKLTAAAAALLLLIAAVVVYNQFVRPKTQKGEKLVDVKIIFSDAEFDYKIITETETVFELLKELNAEYDIGLITSNGEYGLSLDSLHGKKIEMANYIYFAFYINGEYSEYGISEAPVKNDDLIEFRYVKGEWNSADSTMTETLLSSQLKSESVNPLAFKQLVFILALAGVALFFGLGIGLVLRKK